MSLEDRIRTLDLALASSERYTQGKEVGDGFPDEERVQGTALTRWDAQFTTFDNGQVFDYGEWQAVDMKNMLRRYGQGRTVENVLTLPLNQLKWKLTPAKGDRGEAEWLRDWLAQPANKGGMSTPMDQIIGLMTSAITYKRACFEKVFTVRDGHHVYDSVQWRPQSTTYLRRDPNSGAFGGFTQDAITREQQEKNGLQPIVIEPMYAFVYLHNSKRDPINGVSDLEIPFWCYKTQQKILFLYFAFLEQHALGKTIVEASDLGRAMQIAQQVRTLKGSGVLPVANTSGANQKIYSLETPQQGASHFMEAIHYLDHTATQSVLAGFVDLTNVASSGGRGSLALSKDQSDFFLMSRQSVATEMAYYIRNYLLADLIFYNFGTDAAVPQFEFESLDEKDITQAISVMNAIIAAPQLNVPDEFIHQLAIAVAPGLNLDVDKVEAAFNDAQFKAVRKALDEQKINPQAAPAAGLGAGVNAAVSLVKKHRPDLLPGGRAA